MAFKLINKHVFRRQQRKSLAKFMDFKRPSFAPTAKEREPFGKRRKSLIQKAILNSEGDDQKFKSGTATVRRSSQFSKDGFRPRRYKFRRKEMSKFALSKKAEEEDLNF